MPKISETLWLIFIFLTGFAIYANKIISKLAGK
jgi:hypothetical protein